MARRGGHHVSHHRHRHSRGGARVQAAHRLELKGDHTVDQTFKGGGRARWAQRHAERPTPRPKQLLVLERNLEKGGMRRDARREDWSPREGGDASHPVEDCQVDERGQRTMVERLRAQRPHVPVAQHRRPRRLARRQVEGGGYHRCVRTVLGHKLRRVEGLRSAGSGREKPVYDHQRPSVEAIGSAIRGHQRSSEVIRGHQRPSEVIRGHQWRRWVAPSPAPRRADPWCPRLARTRSDGAAGAPTPPAPA